MTARPVAFPRGMASGCPTRPTRRPAVGSRPPQVDSPLCEEFGRTPRGKQGQAVRRGRRGRVRSRHRSGVQDDRPRGEAARLPQRQGTAPGARGPHRDRPGTRAGAARLDPAVSRQGRPRARRRPHRHATDRDHGRSGGRAGRVRRDDARSVPRSPSPATAACASSCLRRTQPRRRSRRRSRASCAAPVHSATSTGRPRPATSSRSICRPRATARTSPVSTPRTGRTRSVRAGSPTDFDDELIGASAGDELSFTATPEGHRGAGRLRGHRATRAGARRCPSSPTTGSPRTSASSRRSRNGERPSPSASAPASSIGSASNWCRR